MTITDPKDRPWFVYAIGSAVLLGAIFVFAAITGWPARPDGCVPDKCYCEAFDLADVLAGRRGLRQPVNTLSNLYALVTAAIVAWQVQKDRSGWSSPNTMSSTSPIADAYVFAVLFLGLGSMWLHASISATVSWMDGLSMYVFAGFLIFYTLDRILVRHDASPVVRAVLFWVGWPVVAIGMTLIGVAGVDSFFLILGLVAIYLVLEFLVAGWIAGTKARVYWVLGAVAMGLAVLFWVFSQTGRKLCFPDSWFQPHGLLWHPLAGVMAVMMYYYWRQENRA